MFNKKTLSLAIAAAAAGLAASSANAAIDLNADTGAVKYAQETVSNTTTGFFAVSGGTAADLDVTSKLGIGVSTSDQIHVRFDLTNAKFDTTLAGGDFSIVTDAGTLAQGGGGQSFAIFSVTVTADRAQTDAATLALGGLSISGSAGVTMSVFETLTGATNQTGALYSAATSGAVSLASALDVDYTPATATAEVTTDFTNFVGPTSDADLGVIDFNLVTGLANAADGSSVAALATFVDLTSSATTFTGDFSFGSWGLNTGTCDTTLLTVATDGATATADAADVDGQALCVTVDGVEIIAEGDYTASTVFDDVLATPAYPLGTSSGTVGSIARNGTSVDITYLTTFDGYNQRVLINNRHSKAANYSFSFQTEPGTTATAGAAATGSIAAGENLVLKVADVVTFTGGTRGSATLNVVAPSNRIDVGTTQVNLSDASTDTVNYN